MSEQICTACGHIGSPKRMTKGSFWIEVVLWFLFLVPGIIYSIWRLTTRYYGCAICGGGSIIPLSSPMGQKLVRNQKSPLGIEPPPEKPKKSTREVADLASQYGDLMARKK